MAGFERFHYRNLAEIEAALVRLAVALPTSNDLSVLAEPVQLGPVAAPNRLVVHPMEGCDSAADGSPTQLVRRRCRRFAAGGAGLVWFEACAVVPEGRANPRQMMITEANVAQFRELVLECRAAARESMGPDHRPVFLLQLTHSGRYSRPQGRPAPILAHHSPALDESQNIAADHPLISDDELDRLQDAYVDAARLAGQAGFDGVDVKSCHGYLLAGLLAAFTREGSRYGGPQFESRTRMLRQVHRRISAELPGLIVTARMNAYDPLPHPHGWGADRQDHTRTDATEPARLAGDLEQQGAPCVSITLGNPYFHPHYNRPYDDPLVGCAVPAEHPLVGVHRLISVARDIQRAHPRLKVIGTGYSYLRQFMPWFAAGVIRAGWSAMVGLGRGALAYPDFARDILRRGRMDRTKTCITCSRCSEIMRDGGTTGCVVRDREVYGPIYSEGRRQAAEADAR